MRKLILSLVGIIILSMFVYGAESDSALVKITMLNQDPNPARAGDTVTLRFKVENTGGQAVKALNIELVQDYPFTIASGTATKIIDNLNPYTTGDNYVNMEYTVKVDKDAVQGQKQLKVRYKDSSNAWVTSSYSISIMTKEFAQIIIDKSKLEPGKETDIKFTITNSGSAPLQNLVFSWEESNGVILPVYSSDTKYVKYLDVGQSVDLTYTVIADVNTNPGLYQLTLILKSESLTNTTISTTTTKAGIFIGGETDFDVAFSESSAGQTSLSVANTGNNPALSVTVRIPEQDNFRVSGSTSSIIGNLDKGDYTIVSFQITQTAGSGLRNRTANRQQSRPSSEEMQQIAEQFAQRNASQNNNLKVLIEYTDTTGTRRTVEKIVPIQFRSDTAATDLTTAQGAMQFGGRVQPAQSKTGYWITAIIILAVGIFLWMRKKETIKSLFKKIVAKSKK